MIKLIAIDVDGTLTDGKIIMGDKDMIKAFHVRDGLGIHLAKAAGIKIGIISSGKCKATERRAAPMDFCIQGCGNKLGALERILKSYGLLWEEVCFIGDDLNDLAVMNKVGLPACPVDAHWRVKVEIAGKGYISTYRGGHGAVRDIIEDILEEQGMLKKAMERWIK